MAKRQYYKVSLYRGLGLRKIDLEEYICIAHEPHTVCLGTFAVPGIEVEVFEWNYVSSLQNTHEVFLIVRKTLKGR